jgi:hypothetical protein
VAPGVAAACIALGGVDSAFGADAAEAAPAAGIAAESDVCESPQAAANSAAMTMLR